MANPTPIPSDAALPVELAQAQAPGAAAGESIGQVSAVEGSVAITHPDGTKVIAAAGTPIFQGDLVETAEGGAVGITFADDSTFSLADSGSMVIDQMVYDPASQSGKSVISVAEGVFTFVSGQIAKTDVDAMVIKTPVAVIGIRGTAGGGKAGPEGTPNTFTMFADPNGIGEMVINTNGGNVIFSKALQTTQVVSAFLPPLKPIVLPPSVAAQFYAKATTTAPTKPVIDKPAGDAGGPGGPTDAPPAEAAAEEAAAQAFADALAAGGSLDDAIGAAAGAAATAALEAVLTENPEIFGTLGAADAILTDLVAKSLGDLAGAVGGGLFGGAGNDVLGPPVEAPPAIFIVFVPPPPPIFVQPIILPPPDDDDDLPPPPGFDEVIFGTLGNDTLISASGANTQFIMVQGTSLGGTDQLFGNDGTDQIKFDNLSSVDAVYNQTGATTGTIDYAGAVNGSITLDSIELIFFDNGLEGFQGLEFDAVDVGEFGYLRAGGAGADTLSTASGTVLAGTLGTVTSCDALLLGSVIFGGGGDDTLTGSTQEDIILGGTGNDILDGNLAGDESDGDFLFGGAGDDLFLIGSPSAILNVSTPVGTFDGGETGETNGDTLRLVTAGTYQFANANGAVGLFGFEVLDLSVVGIIAVAPQSFLGSLTSVRALPGTNTLKSSDATLDMFSVADTNTNVTNLLATDAGSGVFIRDFNDAGGRIINGSANADNLNGLGGADDIDGLAGDDTVDGGAGGDTLSGSGGADTVNLGSGDGAADVVVFHALTDGSAFGSLAIASADDINDFVVANDQVEFDDATMGLNGGVQSGGAASGTVALGGAVNGIFYINDLTAANLDNFSQVQAAIGSLASIDPGDKAIFVVNRTSVAETGIYAFQDVNNDTTVDANELALLGVVDATLTDADLQVSAQ